MDKSLANMLERVEVLVVEIFETTCTVAEAMAKIDKAKRELATARLIVDELMFRGEVKTCPRKARKARKELLATSH